ncbi:hypothetical protein [Rathayibacter rathayi]|uniref:Uncharacterized protein n=1 Tax=Rathayibacter rathayi TaxID=33887 RepID=A0ABD6W6X4_RATRA|nr:hypothetical protein [Rathayibacter rathayi]MWV75841.1 hypothetical protein [Rathayibacter rathayi NCPPB 2980 = VKM Ac-1601]PPF11933.1 hypothetical protein C5C04_11385 [Rathayibacter rathayi]PPF45171.1 hypothetical protein C5C08_12515 [Rathayibacter rathayi]PPG66408.1 hypothetical protein C5C16_11220 [Rathayibacter rathayi]PPG75529.1 hypothetical protein C5C15_12590 [Rathayibacter rathayi]
MSAALTLVTALGDRVAIADLADLQQVARKLFGGYGDAVAPTLASIDAATTLQEAADELAHSTGAHLIVSPMRVLFVPSTPEAE